MIIGDMRCANCVSVIQGRISELPSTINVEVNLADEKAVLEFDSSRVKLNTIEKANLHHHVAGIGG